MAIKKNTEELKEITVVITSLLAKTDSLRDGLTERFMDVMGLCGADYRSLDKDARLKLGALVNDTLALARLLNEKVEVLNEAQE